MFDGKSGFVIEDYSAKPAFTSFLPGISGIYGIPIWCFYVNRGQCICSFGVEDKDHAIMEFFPAHQAYQNTARLGFRTFVKRDGQYFEPFSDIAGKRKMIISGNSLTLSETDEQNGLVSEVKYCTLPNERIGALMRRLSVTNISSKPADLELLDGMPALIPYGVNMRTMKMMAQTAKAWMRTENIEQRVPRFRVSVSMSDTAHVSRITGSNFAFAVDESGILLESVVDTEHVFGFDTSLSCAVNFAGMPLARLLKEKQITVNRLPCCLFARQLKLDAGKTAHIYQIIGQADSDERMKHFLAREKTASWFEQKFTDSETITEILCDAINTKTADPLFDAYCRQTYLDNVLRGGKPVFFGSGPQKKSFWIYGRRHGDPERDYNDFHMSAEFFSQGNGNYRDVNQNRRCDVLFDPEVGNENIKRFFSLIQIDGGNPLSVESTTCRVTKGMAQRFACLVEEPYRNAFCVLISSRFSPGMLAMAAQDWQMAEGVTIDTLLDKVIGSADTEEGALFGQGYWSDHFTYNLDLIESYLAVYPENERTLLFERVYPWFESNAMVLPRSKRYVLTPEGVRQYGVPKRQHKSIKWMRAGRARAYSSIMEKMLVICGMKFACLDPSATGIEMEGGKPGWYDALNGLPGIFGSSMAESCELCRMLGFILSRLRQYSGPMSVYREVMILLRRLSKAALDYQNGSSSHTLWDCINTAKEDYRSLTASGVSGEIDMVTSDELYHTLEPMHRVIVNGIEKACKSNGGICPTYYTHQAVKYTESDDGIRVDSFNASVLPLFLEGPVRWFKLNASKEEKLEVYKKIKRSALYDDVLRMYKVNEPLDKLTYEAGRACAFTPGWLENESIWLHMEYKYLLELLKSGLYEQFADDFRRVAIPFLDPNVYGRSTLENSSFIASSANPDPSVHGRGFVSRLSGSTAEFLQIWQIMMFGKQPFRISGNQLLLILEPFIPKYLMPKDGIVCATLLGRTRVEYHSSGSLLPGASIPVRWELCFRDGGKQTLEGYCLKDKLARAVRDGSITHITVWIETKRREES